MALGHEPVRAPLLEIEFLEDVPLNLDGAQAIVITSRNALRALGTHPERHKAVALPIPREAPVTRATRPSSLYLRLLDI